MRRSWFGIALAVLASTITLLGSADSASAGIFFGNRSNTTTHQWASRHGTWTFSFPAGYSGNQTYDPNHPPKRYFDSTGRWTGDGVDSMATTPRTSRCR
jgi:hypothetical protein